MRWGIRPGEDIESLPLSSLSCKSPGRNMISMYSTSSLGIRYARSVSQHTTPKTQKKNPENPEIAPTMSPTKHRLHPTPE